MIFLYFENTPSYCTTIYMASKFAQVRAHGAMQPYISMQW